MSCKGCRGSAPGVAGSWDQAGVSEITVSTLRKGLFLVSNSLERDPRLQGPSLGNRRREDTVQIRDGEAGECPVHPSPILKLGDLFARWGAREQRAPGGGPEGSVCPQCGTVLSVRPPGKRAGKPGAAAGAVRLGGAETAGPRAKGPGRETAGTDLPRRHGLHRALALGTRRSRGSDFGGWVGDKSCKRPRDSC